MVFQSVLAGMDYLSTPLIDSASRSASLGRGQTCWKYTQIVVSCIFIIFGGIACWQGSTALLAQSSSGTSARHNQRWPIGLIISGSCTIIFSIIGIIAVKLESIKLLLTYIVLTSIASIIMLVISCLVLTQSMPDIAAHWAVMSTTRIKALQTSLDCCGLHTLNDSWAQQPCPANPLSACLPLIESHIHHVITLAGSVGISFSVVMLCTLASTAVLTVAVKRKHIYVRTSNTDYELEDGIYATHSIDIP